MIARLDEWEKQVQAKDLGVAEGPPIAWVRLREFIDSNDCEALEVGVAIDADDSDPSLDALWSLSWEDQVHEAIRRKLPVDDRRVPLHFVIQTKASFETAERGGA